MKTTLLFILTALIAVSHHLAGQNIAGSWKGELNVQGNKLPLIFNISREKEVYTATMDSPLQAAEGIPVDKITFTDPELILELSSIGAVYKGKFDDGKISGQFVQRGQIFPLVLEPYDKNSSTALKPEILNLSANITESLQKIESFISYLEKNNAEAGEISIFKDGKEIYKRNFGENNLPQSQKGKETFQIGSITKTMTAIMIFKLIEKNQLNLNDQLSKFYPEIPNAEKITISQLLSHTSGLGDYIMGKDTMKWLTDKVSEEQIMNHIIEQGSLFEPGTQTQYSNSGYYLLAKILEKISKKPYAENLKEYIITPLQLKKFYTASQKPTDVFLPYSYASRWEAVKDFNFNNIVGVGDIATTPTNLNIIINTLFAGKLVSEESLAAMMPQDDKFGRGLAIVPFNTKIFVGHSGGTYGTNSLMIYNGEDDLSISYSLNADRIGANTFVIDILSILYNQPFEMPTFGPEISVADLQKYVGDYTSKDIPLGLKIFVKNDGLFAQGTGQPEFPLEYAGDHQFKFDNYGVKIRFYPEKQQMELKQNGGTFLFDKKK